MRPTLFTIGGQPISSYFFLYMVGALLTVLYLRWLARREGLSPAIMADMGIIGILGGLIGAKLFQVILEAPSFYFQHPEQVIQFWRGGSVSIGAYLGGGLGMAAYLRIRKLGVLKYGDIIILGIPIMQFFGCLGCLMAGCCYGTPTDVPWAITYSNPATAAYKIFPNVPLHPSKGYEMLLAAAMFVFFNWLYFTKRKSFPGQYLTLFFIVYSVPRGILEFWRYHEEHSLWLNGLMSTGQISTLIGGLIFVALYIYLKRRDRAR